MSYVGSLSQVVVDFTERVRQEAPQDLTYQKLVEQVGDGTTKRYRLENEFLYFTGGKLYVPLSNLRRELLSRSFHWPKMKEDMQAYVKTCHVCHVDKTEQKKEAGLL